MISMVAAAGDRVWVEYTGKLTDGTKFDSSLDHPDPPFTFLLGKHQVIAGWDEGIAGMKVGQKRQLIIPPNLGYGDNAQGPIPANSTLIFDVQLLGIKKRFLTVMPERVSPIVGDGAGNFTVCSIPAHAGHGHVDHVGGV